MSFWQKTKSVFAALAMNCREASLAQSEKLDHPLPMARRLGLRLHLLLCQWCRRYGNQLRLLRRAARQREATPAPGDSPSLSPTARDRIKRRLREDSRS